MDSISLSQLFTQINQHINSIEDLGNHLQQAEALIQVANSSELNQVSKRVVHGYLWALGDTIERAQKLNEQLFLEVYKLKRNFKSQNCED